MPRDRGWYWFHAGDDSPVEMTRLSQAVVYVGDDGPGTPLRCVFPRGECPVERMGGEWAGPIPIPSRVK